MSKKLEQNISSSSFDKLKNLMKKPDTPTLGGKIKSLLSPSVKSEFVLTTPRDPTTKEVISFYALKKTQKWNLWKKRWVVIFTDSSVSYFRKKDLVDEIPLGTLILKGNVFMEEISLNDDELEKYIKDKESFFENGQKGVKPVSTSNTVNYRLAIFCPISFHKGEKEENTINIFEFSSQEQRKTVMEAITKMLTESKSPKDKESYHFLFNDPQKYEKFLKVMIDKDPTNLLYIYDQLDISLITEQDILALSDLYISSEFGDLNLVKSAMSIEIHQTLSAQTLFRRNSVSTKLVTVFIKSHGLSYVKTLMKDYILDIIKDEKNLEIDPNKISDENPDSIGENNAKELCILLEKLMNMIYDSKNLFPPILVKFFSHTKKQAQKFEKMSILCVGAVFFLRLLCPVFVSPESFGICESKPKPNPARTLILLTKCLQNIANQVSESKKEPFMKHFKSLVETHIPKTNQFLDDISNDTDSEIEHKKSTTKLETIHSLHKFFKNVHVKEHFKINPDIDVELKKKLNYLYENILGELEISFGLKLKNMSKNRECIPYQEVKKEELYSMTKQSIAHIALYFKDQNLMTTSSNIGHEDNHEILGKFVRTQLIPCISTFISFKFNEWEVFNGLSDHPLIKKVASNQYLKTNRAKLNVLICMALNENTLHILIKNLYRSLRDDFDKEYAIEDLSKLLSLFDILSEIPFKFHLSLEIKILAIGLFSNMFSKELFSRVKRPSFQKLFTSAEDTIKYFKNGQNLGWSGFAAVGYPKVVPITLAEYVKKNNLQKQMAFNLFVGASVGVETEDVWASLDMINERWPFINGKNIAKKINSGLIDMGDTHLSHFAQGLEFGFYCRDGIDIGIIEATEITEDGGIILSGGVGAAYEIIEKSKKLIIEVNTSIPSYKGFHDLVPNLKPPKRKPYLISRVDDRIGVEEMKNYDKEKVIAIVESKLPDNGPSMAKSNDVSKRISEHLMEFFEFEVKRGTLPKNLLPIQSGVGNVPNAVLNGFKNSKFDNIVGWTEVLQDGMLDLLECGKMKSATTTGISLSKEGFQKLYSNFDFYKDKIILRPQEITNSAEIIDRLGVISMNACLEADIYGHVNSTLIDGSKMVHGIGGSGDFFRNAYISIAHFPSSRASKNGDPNGISCIIPKVSHCDHTEHDISVVVTEQGLADLRQLAPRKRARLIIEKCVHPEFKPMLLDYYNFAEKKCIQEGKGHEPQILKAVYQMYTNHDEKGTMKLDKWDF